MSNGQPVGKEEFVDQKIHECYLEFRGPVFQIGADVEDYIKGFFSPRFNSMLGNQYEQIWKRKGEWLLDSSRRLGEYAVYFAKLDSRPTVNKDDVDQAIEKIREDECPEQEQPRPLGGWCSPHEDASHRDPDQK